MNEDLGLFCQIAYPICYQVKDSKGQNHFIPARMYWYYWDADQVICGWKIKPHK